MRDAPKGYEEKTSRREIKEENGEQRERVALIDLHRDPKLVSRESAKERNITKKKDGKKTGTVVAFLLLLPLYSPAFLSPSLSLFFSFSSFNLIKLSRSDFYLR